MFKKFLFLVVAVLCAGSYLCAMKKAEKKQDEKLVKSVSQDDKKDVSAEMNREYLKILNNFLLQAKKNNLYSVNQQLEDLKN